MGLYTYNCTDELTTAATSYQTYATSTAADVTLNADTIEQTYSPMYAVSYMYYSAIGIIITVVVGYTTSLLTKPNNPSQMNPKLFAPFLESPCFGETFNRWFRCGVPEDPEDRATGSEGVPLNERKPPIDW